MTDLTSKETLDYLCYSQPDHPVSYGFKKLAGSIGLMGIGGGLGWFGLQVDDTLSREYPFSKRNLLDKSMRVVADVFIGGAAVTAGGFGIYMFADGLTSLVKPLGMHIKDGSFYFRNDGFTNKPSLWDKRFGTRVNPVDNVTEIDGLEGYILANGVIVQNTSLSTQQGIRYTPKVGVALDGNGTTSTSLVPESYVNFSVILNGLLGHDPIKVKLSTEDAGFATGLGNMKPNKPIYVMGKANDKREITVERYGPAFSR